MSDAAADRNGGVRERVRADGFAGCVEVEVTAISHAAGRAAA